MFGPANITLKNLKKLPLSTWFSKIKMIKNHLSKRSRRQRTQSFKRYRGEVMNMMSCNIWLINMITQMMKARSWKKKWRCLKIRFKILKKWCKLKSVSTKMKDREKNKNSWLSHRHKIHRIMSSSRLYLKMMTTRIG